jgi:hypothetical protein
MFFLQTIEGLRTTIVAVAILLIRHHFDEDHLLRPDITSVTIIRFVVFLEAICQYRHIPQNIMATILSMITEALCQFLRVSTRRNVYLWMSVWKRSWALRYFEAVDSAMFKLS